MTAGSPPIPAGHDDPPAARNLRAAAEAVLLALAAFAPWPFASANRTWELVLFAGLAVVAGLWAAHAAVTRRFAYRPDPVGGCLLGLVLLAAVQLVPLPEFAVRVLSPTRAEWHRTLRPATGEVLPGETPPGPPRPSWLPLTIDPAATREHLVHVAAIFLAYAATRNFVASPAAFRRLAWVGFANGTALALFGLFQFFSTPDRSTIYWTFPAAGEVFGPFVNRNHYVFYAALCAGLGLGLLGQAVRERHRGSSYEYDTGGGLMRSPAAVGLLAGVGLILASVPFSLSRGGLLAVLAAGGVTLLVRRLAAGPDARPAVGRGAVVGLVLVAVGLGTWFGWEPVVRRLGTLQTRAGDNRTWIWREALGVAAKFPVLGAGGGTFPRAELALRTDQAGPGVVINSAHNEYLEAAAEGGVVGFVLAVGLAAAAVRAAVAGARRHRDRSVGPLLLGCVFGLTAVAAQAVTDFGFHTPAVAMLAAVVAGQVSAAAGEAQRERVRVKRKVRVKEREAPPPGEAPPAAAPAAPAPRPAAVLTGRPAYLAAAVVVLVGVQIVLAGWRAREAARLRLAADRILFTSDPARWQKAITFQEAATRLAPDDAEVWNELAALHLAAAAEESDYPFVAAAGPVAAARPPLDPTPAAVADHVLPALRAARTARDLCPVMAGPHLRLGTFAHLLVQGDPAAAYFDRAKRVAAYDPDVWYLSGAAALRRGDEAAAWADWKESLRRSPRRLAAVVRAAAAKLPPDQLRAKVLPDDPATWVAAADVLFADDDDPAGRQGWLRAAAARWAAAPPVRAEDWVTWAHTLERLGDPAAALGVWRRAAERFPDSREVLDGLAARLEADERYDEAVPVLERLAREHPGWVNRDRLESARHGADLRRQIEGQ
jgi:O-antigen ligase/tetratricopeptide (TPR) repeat protein